MVALTESEPVCVPLMIDGVIVGLVSIGDNNKLQGKFSNRNTEAYLKELLLSDLTESISLVVHYAGEPYSHVPEHGELGHIRLV